MAALGWRSKFLPLFLRSCSAHCHSSRVKAGPPFVGLWIELMHRGVCLCQMVSLCYRNGRGSPLWKANNFVVQPPILQHRRSVELLFGSQSFHFSLKSWIKSEQVVSAVKRETFGTAQKQERIFDHTSCVWVPPVCPRSPRAHILQPHGQTKLLRHRPQGSFLQC